MWRKADCSVCCVHGLPSLSASSGLSLLTEELLLAMLDLINSAESPLQGLFLYSEGYLMLLYGV